MSKVQYKSSLKIKNLGEIEKWVAELRSPKWPEAYLPAINQTLAERGKVHYDNYCLQCHQVVSREDEGIPYRAKLTPLAEVKTDPTEIENFKRQLDAGKYEGRLGVLPIITLIPAKSSGANPLVNAVAGALLDHPLETIEAGKIEFDETLESLEAATQLKSVFQQYGEIFEAAQPASFITGQIASAFSFYKARPLDGIWATPPYLHNGSVPNLYEILLPQTERSKVFYLGSREFDAEKVGYVSTAALDDTEAFKFDTVLKGNSNQGHEYGVNELTDEEKQELLEYLKTL